MSLKSLFCRIELGRGISGRFRAFKSSVLIVLNKHMRRERPKRTSEKSYITQKIWNWFCIWPTASKNLIRDSFDWFSFPSDRARWRAAINWYWAGWWNISVWNETDSSLEKSLEHLGRHSQQRLQYKLMFCASFEVTFGRDLFGNIHEYVSSLFTYI